MRSFRSAFRFSGQALSEAIITLPVLVFFILGGVTLYNLMSSDVDANKAARVAVWHGFLYKEGAGGMTRQDIDRKIEENLSRTILDTDRKDFLSGDPLRSKPLVAAIKPGDKQLALRDYDLGSASGGYTSAAEEIGKMVGLDKSNISGVEISIPVRNDSMLFALTKPRNHIEYDVEYQTPPLDPVSLKYQYHVKGKAALLTDGMTPMNEKTFNKNVSDLSADGAPLAAFQPLAAPLSVPLQELRAATGEGGRSTVSEEQSIVLPSQIAETKF